MRHPTFNAGEARPRVSDTPSTAAFETSQHETGQESQAVLSQQGELFARVLDEPIHAPPEDLYIPPEALRVFLETFEGPLDLLLYLIRRQNLDILAVDVAAITHQYIEYVELMEALEIELAGEYLLMAAMLAEIKSRTLLPRPPREGSAEEEGGPRAAEIRRLQEGAQPPRAAGGPAGRPRAGRGGRAARAVG